MKPALGYKRLNEIRPDAIRAAYADLEAGDLSPTTVRLVHTVIRKALAEAVDDGCISTNPAARVRPPRRADFEAVPPTTEELAKILDTADASDDRLAALWHLFALTGARMGELLGLTWDDISLERGAVTIRRALEGVDSGAPVYDTPKTGRGRRGITIGADGLDAVGRHRARQAADKLRAGAAYRDHGLVFCTSVGTALYERNVIRSFKAALKRAEVRDDIRLYDLRHFHVTEAAHAGVSIKALSARVGHASVAFTLDRYAHAFEAADRDVADAVEQAIKTARRPICPIEPASQS